MAMRKYDEEVVFPNAAGIDVGASSHWVAVPRHAAEDPVREFGAMTDDLNALADWLHRVRGRYGGAGVHWGVLDPAVRSARAPWPEGLAGRRPADEVRAGRKSDVQDCQWLQKLMSLGLLRAAWRPGDEVCVVRAVVRQREVLLTEQASWVQRMQKALVQMNIQLTEVITDVMGMTGQAIIRDIVAGERDPQVLARYRNGRVKASAAEIERALTGNWREEHLFVLAQALAMYDSVAQRVAECDTKIEALLAALGRHELKPVGPAKRGGKNTPTFDLRTALARWAGVDLTRINGLAVSSVLTVLSEIGPDLSRFASVKHFCSWLGLCPGTKISGGKVLSARTRRSVNRVRQALKMAAMSLSRSGSALGAFYRRLCARMDKPSANTAIAHKLARMVYFMLTRGEDFVDQGQQHYEAQQRQRSVAALKRRAAALGFVITPIAAIA